MHRKESLAVMKALADDTRLEILHRLRERPGYGEELAAQLNLTASTVSFHLAKLEQAGLVTKTKEQYYTVYSLNETLLGATVRDFFSFTDAPERLHDTRLEAYRRKIVGSFFSRNKLRQMPTQKKKRLIVLEHFAQKFAPGRVYAEQDVNEIITAQYADYCTIRRELIDEGFLSRTAQSYTRTGTAAAALEDTAREAEGKDGAMSSLKEIKMQYKQAPKTAGVYWIRNTANGKFLLGSSLNLHGPWNRHSFALKTGAHGNKVLQADWTQYGADSFTFEILATVKDDPDVHTSDALKALEDEWTARLDPYGEKGYNKDNVVKRIREA
jgi:DNA-binding HxlR family transcriptional regulator